MAYYDEEDRLTPEDELWMRKRPPVAPRAVREYGQQPGPAPADGPPAEEDLYPETEQFNPVRLDGPDYAPPAKAQAPPPSALRELQELKPPEMKPRGWVNKLASIAAGAGVGYINSNPHLRPLDQGEVQAGVRELTMPGETRDARMYGHRRAELERQATIEEKTAKDEREKAEHESTLALSGVRTEAAKKAIAREERLAAGPVFPKDAQEAVFRIRQSGLPKDQQDAQVQQVIDDHAALTTPKAETGHWIEDGKGNLRWIQTPKPGQAPPTPVTFEGVGTPKPPPPTKLLTPEEEAQRIRISQSSRPPGAMASEAAQEELAQSLARGELTRIRDVMSLRSSGNSAAALNVFNRARQLNPKFSTAEIERKIKMESDFTTGRDGQNLQSFGIFLEHAGAASEAIQTVRQTNSPLVLRPINWWKKNVSGDPTFQAFMVSLEPVRKEFEQFLLGGRALYAEDRRAVEVILNDNSTLAQVQSALKQMGHTAKARAQEMNYRYNRVMGKDLEEPFSQEAIVAASKIGVDLTLKPGRGQPQPTAQQREPAGGGDGQTAAGVTVAIPGGKPKWFPTQAKADEFKKAAGLK